MKAKAKSLPGQSKDYRVAASSDAMEFRDGPASSPPDLSAGAPNPRWPASYSRRVLLAVTGLSPQIVTETLYALAARPAHEKQTFVPTEIFLISTQTGKREAELNLLAEQGGWFHKLQHDYQLPTIQFERDHILILRDVNGKPLDDIRTPAENEQAADFITEQVRRLTKDSNSALHVSIAGGRKTMGYYLGYALSLYGRPQDRLSHVLVSEPYEGNREFYYPTPYEHKIHVLRGSKESTWNAQDALVDLAEIPFVRLRDGLPDKLLEGNSSFNETVSAAQRGLGRQELIIDYDHRCIQAGGQCIRLAPIELAMYGWVAKQHLAGNTITCPYQDAPEQDYAADFLAEYRHIIGVMGDDDRTATRLREGMDKAFFEQTLSKLRKKIKSAIWPNEGPYQITGSGKPKRYAIPLAFDAIRFESIVPDSMRHNKLAKTQTAKTNRENRCEERVR